MKKEQFFKTLDESEHRSLNDIELIDKLCKDVSQLTLKYALAEINNLLEARQEKAKNDFKLLPIFTMTLVITIIYVLGIPVEFFGNPLLYGAIAGVSGVVITAKPIIEFTAESGLQSGIFALKRSVFLLEQAKSILENIEKENIQNIKS
ncbi:hypothetical protein H6G17_07815 [Chroococcidiopsis sp. FACHB-1243]|nr:hypothetical protein [Chroococcidiopsis sp. [FACHB-1243]]MBD2305419.1 hypothetical protein [Chroococcidiopsis sp. [FACHB-1243]]